MLGNCQLEKGNHVNEPVPYCLKIEHWKKFGNGKKILQSSENLWVRKKVEPL